MPAWQKRRVAVGKVRVHRFPGLSLGGDLPERGWRHGRCFEADEVHGYTGGQTLAGDDGEVETGAEAQFADQQPSPLIEELLEEFSESGGRQKDALHLGDAIAVMVDIVESPGKGLPIPPDQIGRLDHPSLDAVAIGWASDLIQSLQDPG